MCFECALQMLSSSGAGGLVTVHKSPRRSRSLASITNEIGTPDPN